ncbi:MAG: hypothetical protein KDH15_21530 [Rhodocyclaceae bacterium]|nr:hypothetical protein [Rhodocyclaceae bacterium]
MTRLPLITCPSCNAEMTLDVALGHQGGRDAVRALAELDPGNRLLPATVRYVALFSPPKQKQRLDRFAALVREVAELVRPAKLEYRGRLLPAPRDYWVAAMDEMCVRRESLSLPLKSHGYLKTIVAGYAEKAAATAEARTEAQRGGRTPVGGLPPPAPHSGTAEKVPEQPRKRLTDADRAQLDALVGRTTKTEED